MSIGGVSFFAAFALGGALLLWALFFPIWQGLHLRREKMLRVESTALILLLLSALMLFFQTPFGAENYEMAPDPAEYALGARLLSERAAYYMTLDGQSLPFRYPPWFSFFFLMPVFLVPGVSALGSAVFPVTAMSLLGVVLAFLIGRRLSGTAGAVLAGVFLLLPGSYRFLARNIMADVPVAVIYLAGWFLYLLMRERPGRAGFFAAGLLAAFGAALKPTAAVVALPFFVLAAASREEWKGKVTAATLVCFPLAGLAAATLAYNTAVFGDAFRSGYHFWSPVPYDFPHLIFDPAYSGANLTEVLNNTGIFLFVLVIPGMLLPLSRIREQESGAQEAVGRTDLRHSLYYASYTLLPTFLFYLLYFWPSFRFYLPVEIMLAVLAGACIGGFLTAFRFPVRSLPLGMFCILLITVLFRFSPLSPQAERRRVLQEMFSNTPADAVIISGFDPLFLSALAGEDNQRVFIPVSARVEYASKRVAWQRLSFGNVQPRSLGEAYRLLEVHKEAAKVLAPSAIDGPERISGFLDRQRPIFLETRMVSAAEISQLESLFTLEGVRPGLFRVQSRNRA